MRKQLRGTLRGKGLTHKAMRKLSRFVDLEKIHPDALKVLVNSYSWDTPREAQMRSYAEIYRKLN